MARYSSRLIGMRRDVVEGKRGDDRVAAGELVLEPRIQHLEPTGVQRASRRGDFEHVRIDVDELDAHVGQGVENRGGKTSGSGSEIEDEPSWRDVPVEPVNDCRDHPLVVRDERADCPVVVISGHAEVASDAMLIGHQLRI
jgi:hypothetical protein